MRMMRSCVFACLAAVFLSACATLPEIPYDSSSAGAIKNVAIVTPSVPASPTVFTASTVGQSFGLIGALVDAGIQSNRESNLKTLLAQKNFDFKSDFVADISKGLKDKGFETEVARFV